VNPELEGYQAQLTYIRQDVIAIVAGLTDAQFNWRPGPDRWSIAECFDHLNLTARQIVPAIDSAIADANARGLRSDGPFVYPMLDQWFVKSNEPPVRRRYRALRRLRPQTGKGLSAVMDEFIGWQEQLTERVRQADGVDLRRARRRSPVLPIVRWSLGTMFAVTLAHERRHIWQARHVRNALRA
jgi:hypothetical protein